MSESPSNNFGARLYGAFFLYKSHINSLKFVDNFVFLVFFQLFID